MEKRRVGILGGSFDPPTLAHAKLGDVFLNALNLDEVRYVLARQNPLKSNYAVGTTKQRWTMLMKMVEGHPKYSASDIEIVDELVYDEKGRYVKTDDERPSYAYNTMKAFEMCEPHTEFFFLGGSDILRKFYNWHKAEKLIEEFKIGISVRPPHSVASTIAPVREEHRGQIILVEDPMPDMSSTDVRSFFDSGLDERAKVLLNGEIYEYIVRQRVYENPQVARTV